MLTDSYPKTWVCDARETMLNASHTSRTPDLLMLKENTVDACWMKCLIEELSRVMRPICI